MAIIQFPAKIPPEIREVYTLGREIDNLVNTYLSNGGDLTLLVGVLANRLGELIRSGQPITEHDLYGVCEDIILGKIL